MSSGYEDYLGWEEDMSSNLYKTSETYRLDALQFSEADEIGAGGCGNIFKGTISRSYGVHHKLYRGKDSSDSSDLSAPFMSYRYFFRRTPGTRATDETISVAVKTIRSSEDEVIDTMREASNLRVLQGTRNTASVYGVTHNKEMQSVCIVMELVHGPDLNSFLRKRASPSCWDWWKTKLEIFMELVIGLSVCHQRGVYHGDLKGKNVLMDERFMVPKLIDFGFSFRKKDVDYLRSLGGSPFWISPELDEAVDEIPPEVLANPFPSDVYSLGMVLVEMVIDGDIPEYMDSYLVMQKYMGGSPIELEVPEGMEDLKEGVFDELFAVVDGCCSAERDDRISLGECLARIQGVYSNLCCRVLNPGEGFVTSKVFMDMLELLRARFPEVPDSISLQPDRNMMVSVQGTLLVDLFCQVDFKEGVEFIIDRGGWDFNPKMEVPRLSGICVKHGSERVLHFLVQRWWSLILEEEWLLHEACEGDSLEVFRLLFEEVGMEYDTWSRTAQLKPLHRLAFRGKLEMMKLLLERATKTVFDYVNTIVDPDRKALDYAIEGDKVDAVFFLIEHGGAIGRRGADFLKQLFYCAMLNGSLRVAASLLEASQLLKTAGANLKLSPEVLRRFKGHRFGCLELGCFENECFGDSDYVLQLLKVHLEESELSGVEALSWACSKHGNAQSREVFRMMVLFCGCGDPSIYKLEKKLWRLLGQHGSKEMVVYAMELHFDIAPQFLREAAIQHGNTEIVDLLGAAAEVKLPAESKVKKSGDVLQVCRLAFKESLLIKSKLCSTPASFVQEVFKAVESLEGTEILDKIEEMTHEARIWTSLGPELLQRFAFSGSLEMVEHLLAKGVPARDAPEYKHHWISETPLMRAVSGNHFSVAKKLLLAGADPNARMKAGYTCMDIALGMNNAKVVRLLIKFGFDTGAKNLDNETYMDLIARREDKP